MDNRKIDVVSIGDESLKNALSIIWPNAVGSKATHYAIINMKYKIDYYGEPDTTHHYKNLVEDPEGTPTLVLLWAGREDGAEKLPFNLDFEGSLEFVKGWLKGVDYGPTPDIDGDSEPAWRVFTEQWGHIGRFTYSIVAIQPAYAMYGK